MPIYIPSLSIEIAKTCNLSCEGCNHFSNISSLKGFVAKEEVQRNVELWSPHLSPNVFRIVGGEPLINQDIISIIEIIRKSFKNSRIDIFTNGILLKNSKYDENFGKKLAEINACIRVSVHSLNRDYLLKLEPAKEKLKKWNREYGLKFEMADAVSNWTWPYKSVDGKIYPYDDNNQKKSWNNCQSKWCKQLYKEKIYKCQLAAYLGDVKEQLSEHFVKYLSYEPLEHTATEKEMIDFFNLEDEFMCSACPINPKRFIKSV